MSPTRGDIVDYDMPDNSPNVQNGYLGAGDTMPMIVVHCAADGKSYSGVVFLPGGSTEYVTVENPDEPEPAETPVIPVTENPVTTVTESNPAAADAGTTQEGNNP